MTEDLSKVFMHDRQLGFPRNAFWVVILFAVPAVASTRPWSAPICVLLGVLWQLVYRRDLVHRLAAGSVWSAFAVVMALAFAALPGTRLNPGAEEWEPLLTSVWLVVVGLVLCELWLRVRDDRRARRAIRNAGREAVPTRP